MFDNIIAVQELLTNLPYNFGGRVRIAHGPHESSQIIIIPLENDDDPDAFANYDEQLLKMLDRTFKEIEKDGKIYWDNNIDESYIVFYDGSESISNMTASQTIFFNNYVNPYLPFIYDIDHSKEEYFNK